MCHEVFYCLSDIISYDFDLIVSIHVFPKRAVKIKNKTDNDKRDNRKIQLVEEGIVYIFCLEFALRIL